MAKGLIQNADGTFSVIDKETGKVLREATREEVSQVTGEPIRTQSGLSTSQRLLRSFSDTDPEFLQSEKEARSGAVREFGQDPKTGQLLVKGKRGVTRAVDPSPSQSLNEIKQVLKKTPAFSENPRLLGTFMDLLKASDIPGDVADVAGFGIPAATGIAGSFLGPFVGATAAGGGGRHYVNSWGPCWGFALMRPMSLPLP